MPKPSYDLPRFHSLFEPMPWVKEAGCRPELKPDGMTSQEWTSLWFPLRGKPTTGKIARAICFGCPVRAECADRAMTTGEIHGIWGMLVTSDRRRIREGTLTLEAAIERGAARAAIQLETLADDLEQTTNAA